MGLFSRVKEELQPNWKVLNQEHQIDQLIERSFERPQVIFKHSISCGISAMAKHNLEMNWEADVDTDFYYLDLISFRAVSNQIADRFNVTHQSPQLIFIKDGQAIDKVSHHAIHFDWIKDRTTIV